MSESEVEKCPKCGNPMVKGKLTGHAAFTGQATLTWIDNKKGWRDKEHLDSFHNPKGVRAYRCKECGIIICHEKKE